MAKTELLTIRISLEVKSILAEKASTLGMSMSEYARLLILEDARKALATTDNERMNRDNTGTDTRE